MNVLKSKKELITLGYGKTTLQGSPYNHTGLDFVKQGYQLDGIIAGATGKVVAIRNNVAGVDKSAGYGNYIKLKHNDGYETLYCHLKLNSIKVKVGDIVKAGTEIAYMGATGFVTGAHLHFEVRINGKCVDPTPYMKNTKTIPGYEEENITPAPAGEYMDYKIKSGDTLSEIAQAYGTTYQKLAEINGIENPNLIIAGTTIKVPVVKTRKVKVIATRGLNCRKGPGLNYVVIKAYKYGANLEIIEEKNGWGRTAEGWVCLDYVQ